MTCDLTVCPIEARDRDPWRGIWDEYCAFYEVSLSEAVTRRTFANLLSPDAASMRGLVAELDGRVVGIAHVIVHENTWELAPVAYLEDLAGDGDVRGRGVGRALIERVIADARAMGLSRVYWQTHRGNTTARRLYDAFTAVDESHVRYVVRLHG
jgi:GNAT superfamily N-acetyltransferase